MDGPNLTSVSGLDFADPPGTYHPELLAKVVGTQGC